MIVEDSYASRRVLKPKEWMKETWGKCVWQGQVEVCSCTISELCHTDTSTYSLTAVYHCNFVYLNINWNAAKIAIMIPV